uniref:Uncharacterized protein n=1 Tax=Cyanidium caldarium TaxID=2771 RepID=Q9TM36_CYACA|nr:hypothetical protein JXY51_pgp191 [Cyanidium caldarium]AAF13015.1 unknown [Cyanidium caldarium]
MIFQFQIIYFKIDSIANKLDRSSLMNYFKEDLSGIIIKFGYLVIL